MKVWGQSCISSLTKETYEMRSLSLCHALILGVHHVPDDLDVFVLDAHKAYHSERKLWTLMPSGVISKMK